MDGVRPGEHAHQPALLLGAGHDGGGIQRSRAQAAESSRSTPRRVRPARLTVHAFSDRGSGVVVDDKIGAVSVDARWVADKLSEYGFTAGQLEALYPSAEIVAREWAARGDGRIGIDLVTGEMKRRYKLSFSNTVRPFLARMLRDRRPELRPLIKVSTTSRGSNKNLKVVLDHLNVVGVVIRTAEGTRTYPLDEAIALANQARAAEANAKRRPKVTTTSDSTGILLARAVREP